MEECLFRYELVWLESEIWDIKETVYHLKWIFTYRYFDPHILLLVQDTWLHFEDIEEQH